ncbi:Hypothetical predicted protein [Paramuricea clavata]|uniref:Uncharacterized protein n=1 Tax=Paramuricea clavata TaxID=317549 RepID=A0A6S7J8A8_PARCT|nr:Hypothetical predicted protein [Paramuricea clavata]
MFSTILLALGVVLAISASGSALKCNVCAYWTTQPKEQQKCPNTTVNCITGTSYCYTASVADQNDYFTRGCATNATLCLDPEKLCNVATTKLNLKSCALECCTTDNCNNYTLSSATGAPSRATGAPSSATGAPSSATSVMVSKFTLSLMVIVGFICLT